MDIRKFFGASKAVKKEDKPGGTQPLSEVPSKQSGAKDAVADVEVPRKRSASGDADALEDSDDETGNKVQQRRRLLAKQTTGGAASKEPDRSLAPLALAEREPTEASVDLTAASPKSEVKPPRVTPPTSFASFSLEGSSIPKDRAALKPLPKVIEHPSKLVKEVKGGASSFFGETAIKSPDTPVGVKGAPPMTAKEGGAPAATSKQLSAKATQAAAGTSESSRKRSASVDSDDEAESKQDSRRVPPKKANTAKKEAAAPCAEQCLDGVRVAVTGVMEASGREELESMVLSLGGKVAGSVSGKTTYLVAGALLEDGRPASESSKYRTALEKGVRILSEEEFLALVARLKGALRPRDPPAPAPPSSGPSQAPPSSASSSALGKSSSSSAAPPARTPPSQTDMLWVDKYKPTSVSDVIGAGDTVKKLTDWLRNWTAMHIKKSLKPPFSKENPGAKAVLLSGPPGIGKSTIASVIGTSLGYEILELNASDTRSKRAIHEELADAVVSTSIGFDGRARKRLVVMDEVDGMGGSDRGGIAELIQVIKASKTPVVCICNDRQSVKIRSLANHCYDLRVRRPTKTQMAQRLSAIAKKEGLDVDMNALEMLCESVGGDIRQVLNVMQMWRTESNSMRFMEVKDSLVRIEKDKILRQSPFDACQLILSGKSDLNERYNCFFVDYSLIPLLVQENYIEVAKNGIFKNPAFDDASKLNRLAAAADALSDMELAGSSIMGENQHWELLPAHAGMCVRAGALVQGFQAVPSFPRWLGKNSTKNKKHRLTQEIVLHTSLSIRQGFLPVRLEYVPYLREILLNMLLSTGSENAIDALVQLFDELGISKDDFTENMKELQFVVDDASKIQKCAVALTNRYDLIDSKVKAALTRAYNSVDHKSQALVAMQTIKKKRGGGGGGGEEEFDPETGELIEAAEDEAEEANENDVGDVSAFVKKMKKGASRAPAKPRAPAAAKATTKAKKK